MKDQWINKLQQKLTGYQQSAPELSWADIEKTVAENRKNSKGKIFSIWGKRSIAAAIAILIIGGTCYMTLLHDDTSDSFALKGTKTQSAKIQEDIAEKNITGGNSPIANIAQIIYNITSDKNKNSNNDYQPVLMAMATTGGTQEQTIDSTSTSEIKQPAELVGNLPTTDKSPARSSERYTTTAFRHTSSHHNHSTSITAKIYASGGLGGNGAAGNGKTPVLASYMSDPGDYSKEELVVNAAPKIEEHVRHKQPISIGVSLRIPINDKWSIESGVKYSYLSSDITHTTGNNTTVTNQSLQYIGIPVNAIYNIWSNRHFNVYASAGAMIQKMVKGKLSTSIGDDFETTDEKITMKKPQYSVNAAIGAEYKLQDAVSIYAEPGVGYYFDNHSNVPTIYQDKKLNLNLNVGIRFNFNK